MVKTKSLPNTSVTSQHLLLEHKLSNKLFLGHTEAHEGRPLWKVPFGALSNLHGLALHVIQIKIQERKSRS